MIIGNSKSSIYLKIDFTIVIRLLAQGCKWAWPVSELDSLLEVSTSISEHSTRWHRVDAIKLEYRHHLAAAAALTMWSSCVLCRELWLCLLTLTWCKCVTKLIALHNKRMFIVRIFVIYWRFAFRIETWAEDRWETLICMIKREEKGHSEECLGKNLRKCLKGLWMIYWGNVNEWRLVLYLRGSRWVALSEFTDFPQNFAKPFLLDYPAVQTDLHVNLIGDKLQPNTFSASARPLFSNKVIVSMRRNGNFARFLGKNHRDLQLTDDLHDLKFSFPESIVVSRRAQNVQSTHPRETIEYCL